MITGSLIMILAGLTCAAGAAITIKAKRKAKAVFFTAAVIFAAGLAFIIVSACSVKQNREFAMQAGDYKEYGASVDVEDGDIVKTKGNVIVHVMKGAKTQDVKVPEEFVLIESRNHGGLAKYYELKSMKGFSFLRKLMIFGTKDLYSYVVIY